MQLKVVSNNFLGVTPGIILKSLIFIIIYSIPLWPSLVQAGGRPTCFIFRTALRGAYVQKRVSSGHCFCTMHQKRNPT